MNILEIESPGDIFTGDPNTLESEYKRLARIYHPDYNDSPTSNEEFTHLKELYDRAEIELKDGYWEGLNSLNLPKYRLRFHRRVDLPIGRMYVGDTHVTYLIPKEHKGLLDNAISVISGFKYASDKMQKEMSRFLPAIKATDELPNYHVLVLGKTPDLLLLRDIPMLSIPQYDRHAAWIISSLLNTMCYLEYAGITHNDISLDTYFVSFEYHSGVLLGGWWYSCKKGNKLSAVPAYAYDLFSPAMKASKTADHTLDKELVRALGRELLGDRTGTKLIADKVAPQPFVNWLRCASTQKAVEEYRLWDKVLEASYGKRKFIKQEMTASNIYGGK